MAVIFEGLFIQGELLDIPPIYSVNLKNVEINGDIETVNKYVTLKNFQIAGNDDKIRKVYIFEFDIITQVPQITNALPQENYGGINTPQLISSSPQLVTKLINTPQITLGMPFIVAPPMIKVTYPFEFNILEVLAYPFEFNILGKFTAPFYFNILTGTSYPFEFNILESIRTVVRYEGFYFNIIETIKVYGDFEFDIVPSRFLFEFNIAPITSYPFEFNIVGNQRDSFDFMFDITESWCSIALSASATPISGGTITPSTSKRRLNLRVFYGDVLAGAGSAVFTWNGPGNARIQCVIGGIPILGGTMTIKVFENSVLKINTTATAAESWSGYYGNS